MQWWIKVIYLFFEDLLSVRSIITLGAFGVFYWEVVKNPQIPTNTDLKTLITALLAFWFVTKTTSVKQNIPLATSSKPKAPVVAAVVTEKSQQ